MAAYQPSRVFAIQSVTWARDNEHGVTGTANIDRFMFSCGESHGETAALYPLPAALRYPILRQTSESPLTPPSHTQVTSVMVAHDNSQTAERRHAYRDSTLPFQHFSDWRA